MFNRYVRPVCLWNSSNTDVSGIVGKLGTIVGLERTDTGGLSNVLQEAKVPVVSQITCLESDRNLFGHFLTETSFCAGHHNGLFDIKIITNCKTLRNDFFLNIISRHWFM